jgi:glycerophosphoryl diester phosphodiesterase
VSGFLDGDVPIAFAHRGFSPDGWENSMAAFEAAVHLGYRYLETDVRATADGVALAFHDASLARLTNRSGRIAELTWDEVRPARIHGVEPIARLVDLFAAWPDVRINIDVKSDTAVQAAIDAIRASGAIDRVCVAAFSDRRIHAVRQALGPGLCTALGPRAALRLKLPPSARGRLRIAGRCAQVPARIGGRVFVDARYVAAAHAHGLAVHAWTVNDAAEMTRLLDLGVDGIITDRADVLKELLVERGQWPGGAGN